MSKKVVKVVRKRQHVNFIQADPNKEKAVVPIVLEEHNRKIYVCPECNKKVEKGDRYCRHCGYKLSFESPFKKEVKRLENKSEELTLLTDLSTISSSQSQKDNYLDILTSAKLKQEPQKTIEEKSAIALEPIEEEKDNDKKEKRKTENNNLFKMLRSGR